MDNKPKILYETQTDEGERRGEAGELKMKTIWSMLL